MGVVLLLSATSVLADEPRAVDGETFAAQSSDTQAPFRASWGDEAASHWLQEHNAALGSLLPVPQVAAPAPVSAQIFIQMTDHDTFSPAALTVPLGAAITWHNYDTDPHTVTFDPSKGFPGVKVVQPAGAQVFDSGLIDADQSFTYVFDLAGHYIYICTVHAGKGMVATLDVV
jgi:plastocyanin